MERSTGLDIGMQRTACVSCCSSKLDPLLCVPNGPFRRFDCASKVSAHWSKIGGLATSLVIPPKPATMDSRRRVNVGGGDG